MTPKPRPSAVADKTADEAPRRRTDEPVSLHPLTFEEALEGLLKVDPREDKSDEGET